MKTKSELNQIVKILNKKEDLGWTLNSENRGEYFLMNEIGECLYSEDLEEYDDQIKKSKGTGKGTAKIKGIK